MEEREECMNIKTVVLASPFGTNCYLVSTEGAAVVVDPGEFTEEIKAFLDNNCEKERLILITHAHLDHIGGAAKLRELTGVKIAVGEKDSPATSDGRLNLSALFGEPTQPFVSDILLNHGDRLCVGDIEFTVIHTPGHTVGGVCYLTGDVLFSGDTLFAGSIGRSDFPGGDHAVLMNSIKMLTQTLDGDTKVYSGHGFPTTLTTEIKTNPYLNLYETL